MKRTVVKFLARSILAVTALWVAIVFQARGATYTVTTFSDVINAGDGVLSLREAVIAANANPGPDTIVLFAGTYTLTIVGANEDAAATGDLDISDDVTIMGAGESQTFIDASGISGDRAFQIISGTVTMSGLAIQNGS